MYEKSNDLAINCSHKLLMSVSIILHLEHNDIGLFPNMTAHLLHMICNVPGPPTITPLHVAMPFLYRQQSSLTIRHAITWTHFGNYINTFNIPQAVTHM